MFNWKYASPARDSSFELSTILHEYGHGLSTRLTGGRKNVDCLDDGESGAMGEGWSDILGLIMRINATNHRNMLYPEGDYLGNNIIGIRKYPVRCYQIFHILFHSTGVSLNFDLTGFLHSTPAT
jgi:extracellular elastinolytic metalloproteinase